MEIYFKPHPKRLKEQSFFSFINANLKGLNHIPENYLLQSNSIEKVLIRDEIIQALNSDALLSSSKKIICISELQKLPNEIRIAENISRISVDFVICAKDKILFIEFHEKQHRNLSVSRMQPIFSKELLEYRIPRFLQRFLRDVWRYKYFDNYKIIWCDWFEFSPKPIEFLSLGKSEFFLPGKFSFQKFLT